MNVQLAEGMTQLKTTVSRLQQDHHVISSAIGNSAQKTHAKIEKLTEQQRSNYESLLEQEKEKSERLEFELQSLREEQEKEWRSQSDFNKRLEAALQKREGGLSKIFSIFKR
jgi:NADH dehydrogenase/NADH:ubiquinone oxidoreductase subunit G